MGRLGVGIVGCGNISAAYLRLLPLFEGVEVRAVADLNLEAAKARGEPFGLRAQPVPDLMASDDIDIVLNLTIPEAHFDVSMTALEAGKHVYSEKPFVLTLGEGKDLSASAAARGLWVGSAPDTFLGGSHQQARQMIDAGALGTVTSGTAFVMSHGMEAWHPNPDFFFLPGAGPVLDMGPYYITNLVQLLGPVARVTSLGATPSATRTIQSGPRAGEVIPVRTPTTIHSIMAFQSGALVTFCASWDVWGHGHGPMELYGSDASLDLPDPNFFGGELTLRRPDGSSERVGPTDHPFGIANDGEGANYRAAGLADMAMAIEEGRPHRCSMDLALHVVEVMTSLLESGETGRPVEMTTTTERPAPLEPEAARRLLVA